MSTLAETYSLACGVPLSRPHTEVAFYPLECAVDKAILLHAFAGKIENGQATAAAKVYSYFAEVIALVREPLEAMGYRFYQIGLPGEPGLPGVRMLNGLTTYHQCAYLVQNCALLIGNDSMWAHQRGAVGRPLVAVYGPTDVKNHGPYWRDPEKTVLIESHRAGKKPSYAFQEHPKTVDWITPEAIANAALKLLGSETVVTRQSLCIGQLYNAPIVEIVPDVVVNPQIQTQQPPIIRMDYVFDEQVMAQNLRLRKCSVITNREIDLTILASLKSQIPSIRVEIDQVSPQWIKAFKKLGIPCAFMAVETDDAKVQQMRLDYYEACLFDRFLCPTFDDFKKAVQVYTQKPLDESVPIESIRFKANKVILSAGKVYLSEAHWRAGVATEQKDANTANVINSQAFFGEIEHFYVFHQN